MKTATLIKLLNDFDPNQTREVHLAFEGTPEAPEGVCYRISLTAGESINSTRIMLYAKAKRQRAPRRVAAREVPVAQPQPVRVPEPPSTPAEISVVPAPERPAVVPVCSDPDFIPRNTK